MAPQRKTTHCHINNGSYMAPPTENNSLPHQQWKLYGSTSGSQLTATSTMAAIWLHQRITTHCHINNGSYMAPQRKTTHCHINNGSYMAQPVDHNSLPHQQWKPYGSSSGSQLTATSTMKAIWLHQRKTTHCHINNGSYMAPPADHNSLPHQQ